MKTKDKITNKQKIKSQLIFTETKNNKQKIKLKRINKRLNLIKLYKG